MFTIAHGMSPACLDPDGNCEENDRGPDSAGLTICRKLANNKGFKLTLFSADNGHSWQVLAKELGGKISIEVRASGRWLIFLFGPETSEINSRAINSRSRRLSPPSAR
jgi:hypothetical protein